MRIGVDIGGGKIEIPALGRDGKEHSRRRVPTPANSDTKIVTAVTNLVRTIEEKTDRRCSGGFGENGCVETFLSGPGLAADFATDDAITAKEVAARARNNDPTAQAAMARYHDRLARALAGVINIFDPDRIVLGGGLSNIASLYHVLPLRLPRYVFSDEVTTPIVPARHGDSSAVRGAARLWPAPEEVSGR